MSGAFKIVICECVDRECPWCGGQCGLPATVPLYRIDLEGELFHACSDCAAAAMDAGVFGDVQYFVDGPLPSGPEPEPEKLRNGAVVLRRECGLVLCSWARGACLQFVTWQTDDDRNAYWGHYFDRYDDARKDFLERCAHTFRAVI